MSFFFDCLQQDSDEIVGIESEESPQATFGFGFTRSRLYLDCLQPQDEGVYTCVADNTFERKSASSNIKITDLVLRDGDLASESTANSLIFCPIKKSYGNRHISYLALLFSLLPKFSDNFT